MRKPLIAAGLLAATLAGGAYAQQPSPPGDGSPGIAAPPAPGGSADAGPQPPPGANPLIMGGPAAGRAMQEQMMRAQQGGPPPMPPPMGAPPRGPRPMMIGGGPEERGMDGMMRHMHPPKGAVFAFRRGDQRVMIKCADDEPTQACVSGATALLDKLGAAPR